MPSLEFFIGKGGVGKTTVSSAYAVWQAVESGERVLLLSTDPAHSLFDIFELSTSRERQSVKASARCSLEVWQLDAEREFEDFLGTYREAVLDVIASGTIFTREEIAPLLDTTIPGMAEVSALLVLADLLDSREYDRIVVDTAPLGHTLRLFELPDAFVKVLRFLQIAASRDQLLAQRFGGRAVAGPKFLDEWERRAEAIREAIAGPKNRLVLVTTPEEFALNESVRAKKALAESPLPLKVGGIVLNRAVTDGGECKRCRSAEKRTAAGKSFLRQNFPRVAVRVAEDIGAPISGTKPLLAFGEHAFGGKRVRPASAEEGQLWGAKVPKVGDVGFRREEWPVLETPLSLTIGKGGVGKTTISAALSYVARAEQADDAVTICSTDPAPSLDDVFLQNVGDRPQPVLHDRNFHAMEVDAVADFRQWTGKVKDKLAGAFGGTAGSVHVDLSFEREVISALLDMVPPGMDELAATFRILDLLDRRRDASVSVVIDMAPTGHALELLRMPERIQLWTRLILRALAPHCALAMAREAAVEIATIEQQVRELVKTLHDEQRCRVYVVMLAEPLPDRETGRLAKSLRELDVTLGPVFVNRLLIDGKSRCALCERKARFQMATLTRLRREHFGTLLAVPEYPTQVAGAAALKKFTRELWRIV